MKNLTKIYLAALGVIALVVVASQYLAQRSLATSAYDSRTINIAGRQSMLSQQIAKAALAMETAENQADFDRARDELLTASRLWELSHHALQYGNADLKIDNVNNSQETLLLFLELETHYAAIKRAVDNLVQTRFTHEGRPAAVTAFTNTILSNEPDFLRLMSEITFDYDNESAERIAQLSRTEYVLLAVALGLLVLEAVFIFRPAINSINHYMRQLEKKEESLRASLAAQQREKARADYLNKQAVSVFENVKEGLCLLDSHCNISDLYSKSMEEIFDQHELAGTNFVHLMRPRLVKRDQEALEMFVKHLFNPEIEEEVLDQLNPVDQVQIFSKNINHAATEPRHISITFSRITDESAIHHVLVSVKDNTATVLMQKKMLEAEERNKRESAQLMSILRSDPEVLREFLGQATHTLQAISSAYEHHKELQFAELISYTFNAIHNLKGNAQLLGIQLLEEKFHQMEDDLAKLREKANIEGNDFLNVLYDINDVLLIAGNMQKILSRLSGGAGENAAAVSNEQLVATLQKGLARLSHETAKQTELLFLDNGIAIPERYKLPIKNIAVQLFRNSVAHGIEAPEERVLKGKPPRATITIALEKTLTGELLFSYTDDGTGLDLQKIAHVAATRRLASPADLQQMDVATLAGFIFSDGFSTAETVGAHAGRGQGLNLLKNMLDAMDARFSVPVEEGAGFRMTIIFPLEVSKQLNQAAV